MKLHPINLSRLTYLDSGQFIVRFLTDYAASGLNASEDSVFQELYNNLSAQSPIFNLALQQIRAQAETEELTALDEIRDKKVIVLQRALSVFEHTDSTEQKTAYTTIKIVLKSYKDITKANYEAESLGLDNLVAELRNAAHLPALQLLGLESHVAVLETANTNFKDKFNLRSTATMSKEVYDTKMLRLEILNTYKELAEYVLVMAKRKKTDYYAATLVVLNNGRQYFDNIIARRAGVTNTATVEA